MPALNLRGCATRLGVARERLAATPGRGHQASRWRKKRNRIKHMTAMYLAARSPNPGGIGTRGKPARNPQT
jgi:hypothetical protein